MAQVIDDVEERSLLLKILKAHKAVAYAGLVVVSAAAGDDSRVT